MLYKITSIKHSGTCGKRGTERTDGRYPLRIGRVVKLNIDDIEIGYPLVIRYAKDSDGTPMKFSFLTTSYVTSVNCAGKISRNSLFVVVETENSIFEFERIADFYTDYAEVETEKYE